MTASKLDQLREMTTVVADTGDIEAVRRLCDDVKIPKLCDTKFRMEDIDVLAEHADAAERAALLREHRAPLLAIGVTCGYLGAAPSLIWAFGVLALPMAPLLLPVYVWLYTLVEVFAALWFAHYMLAALDARRQAAPVLQPLRVEIEPVDGVPMPGAPALPSSASPSSSSSSSLPNPPLLP